MREIRSNYEPKFKAGDIVTHPHRPLTFRILGIKEKKHTKKYWTKINYVYELECLTEGTNPCTKYCSWMDTVYELDTDYIKKQQLDNEIKEWLK